MKDLPYKEYTKAAAICVNLAVDSIEGDIRKELTAATGDAADTLRRLLEKLKSRRISLGELDALGSG